MFVLRTNGDLDALVLGLERQLNRENLDDALRLALTRELGELLYYDLDDPERALPFLETIRQRDPTGLGAEPGYSMRSRRFTRRVEMRTHGFIY